MPEICGAPGRIRTPGQELRRLLLYPPELRARAVLIGGKRLSVKRAPRSGEWKNKYISRAWPPARGREGPPGQVGHLFARFQPRPLSPYVFRTAGINALCFLPILRRAACAPARSGGPARFFLWAPLSGGARCSFFSSNRRPRAVLICVVYRSSAASADRSRGPLQSSRIYRIAKTSLPPRWFVPCLPAGGMAIWGGQALAAQRHFFPGTREVP